MGLKNRIELYNEIEKLRERPLIVYITSGRQGAIGNISQDAIREIASQLFLIPKETTEIDILINSYGGDILTSWRIITMIREHIGKNGKITCLIPHYAFSAAAFLALGCDDIYLHPLSSLSFINNQINVNKKDSSLQFAYEDISAYTKFLKEEAGITEQAERVELLSPLVNQIEPGVIGASKRSFMQSIIMAEKLLKLHMKGADSQKAENIVEKLSKNYFCNEHTISRFEALELGLKISKPQEDLEKLIWNVFTDFEDEMIMRESFDPSSIYLADQKSASLLISPSIINVPSNVPSQLVQQVWTKILSSIAKSQGPTLDFELINAAVESKNLVSRFITKGKIMGCRQPDMNFKIETPKISARWENVSIEDF